MVLDQQVKMEKAFGGPYELAAARPPGRPPDREHGPGGAGQGVSRAAGAASLSRLDGPPGPGDVRCTGRGLRRGRGVRPGGSQSRGPARPAGQKTPGLWGTEK